MSAVPYIGAKISLISKSEIRYEGVLYSIDLKESTVALENVKTFGTEGRRKGVNEIPPSGNVFDYIIFRGSDIKDLQICEPPISRLPQPPNPPPMYMMPRPAMQATPEFNYPPNMMHPYMMHHHPFQVPYMPDPFFPHPIQQSFMQKQQEQQVPPQAQRNFNPRASKDPAITPKIPSASAESSQQPTAAPSQPRSLTEADTLSKSLDSLSLSSKLQENAAKEPSAGDTKSENFKGKFQQRQPGNRRHSKTKFIPNSDFDFVSSNAKFSKDDLPKTDAEVVYYDKKSSFFDNISCEANTPKSYSQWSSAEWKMNLSTFGRSSAHPHRHRKWRPMPRNFPSETDTAQSTPKDANRRRQPDDGHSQAPSSTTTSKPKANYQQKNHYKSKSESTS